MNDRQDNGIETAEDTLVDNGTEAIRIRTPALSSEDARLTYKVIESSLRELWEVVDNLSAVLPPRPTYYRVTMFGSSRIRPGDQLYEDVKRLSAELAAMGCDIVTGGGPGLMQAANEGEHEGDVLKRTYSASTSSYRTSRSRILTSRSCTTTGPSSRDCTTSYSSPARSSSWAAGSAPRSRRCWSGS